MDAAFVLLVEAGLRATLVLGLGWVMTVLLRRASASARHFTWMCTLVVAASMPAAAVVLPDWNVPSPAALRVIGSPFTRTEPTRVQPAATLPTQSQSVASPVESSASPGVVDTVAVALVIWLAGALMVSGYALLGVLAARRMRRKASDVTAPWVDEAHALAEAFEVPLPIVFVESPMTEVPMVCGLRRPAVVMPLGCAAWPRERLRVAVLHELAHVRRRDCATQAFARAMCALYWFSPLMWVAMRRLREERERACDDFVLAAGTKGSEYATHLLEIARRMTPRVSALARAGLSMAHGSQLEGRLMAILNPSLRRSAGRSVRVVSLAVLLLVSVPLAALHLEDPEDRAAAGAEPTSGWQASAEGKVSREVVILSDGKGVERRRANSRAVDRALVESAADGDVQGVMDLLTAGANVNAAIEGDGSPLIAAAREGRLEIARLLLDRGADPALSVPGDGSPLIAAARGGHVAIAELLLQRGVVVDQVVDGDENALIQASGAGQLDMVKLLVSRGADVNARVLVENARKWRTGLGITGWKLAAERAVIEMPAPKLVHYLDDKDGAVLAFTSLDLVGDVEITGTVLHRDSQDGDQAAGTIGAEWRSPLSMARKGGHTAVVEYLLRAGAID